MKTSILGLALALVGVCAAASEQPNVVLIMTDQQLADAMSCRIGDDHIRTPSMDRLARQGMLFTRAYTPNPLCMPARASIFTGRYPHETGVTTNGKASMDPARLPCMGTYLRQAGYDAAYSGKWHLAFNQRESLVDMQADPLETRNLARQPEFRDVLVQHRERLRAFATEHGDALVDLLLADDGETRAP